MHPASAIFQQYADTLTSASTRARAAECVVETFSDQERHIAAVVKNPIGLRFEAVIRYNDRRVTESGCTCDFQRGPVCEHVTAALTYALQQPEEKPEIKESTPYTIPKTMRDFALTDLFRHSSDLGFSKMNSTRRRCAIRVLEENHLELDLFAQGQASSTVTVKQEEEQMLTYCTCDHIRRTLCEHQTFTLNYLLEEDEVRVFFDVQLREAFLRERAAEFGMEDEPHPERFFALKWENGQVIAKPIQTLLPLDEKAQQKLKEQLLPRRFSPDSLIRQQVTETPFLVIGSASYTEALSMKLCSSPHSREGKPKNPIKPQNTSDLLLKTEDPGYLRFYAALTKMQSEYRITPAIGEMTPEEFADEMLGVKAVLANPGNYPVYSHTNQQTNAITATSIELVQIVPQTVSLTLQVEQSGSFYAITGFVEAFGTQIPTERIQLVHRYFLSYKDQWTLIDKYDVLRTLAFLRKNNHKIVIHQGKFNEFRANFLDLLEAKIAIRYSFVKPAPQKWIEQEGLNTIGERLIYLSDSEHFVLITPAVRYGEVEIPVRSSRQLFTLDQTGEAYAIERDVATEQELLYNVIRMHPTFAEQENDEFFYLHKQEFLHSGWFLDAFDYWRENGITILGFNKIKNNNYNTNRMKVRMRVSSETDWFDTHVGISFGKQQATLKQIQKSINNRSRFVQLDDGSLGLLPQEWVNRFGEFFRSGEIDGEKIRIPKSLYAHVDQLFEDEVLSEDVRNELASYKEKAARFEKIGAVPAPKSLQTALRTYQQEGLNWLCFLDDFGFGGCLADDMGLGKTVQVLAFILKQQEEVGRQTNLVVVPTSLIFNWESEIARFTPSLRVLTIHGNSRVRSSTHFDQYDIILTTYGTLLSDITFMKKFPFRSIFLDESQAIKNPDSKRYKAVRLLQGKFKMVLTGTPVENNTFDLYAQLSFAVPGLLGTPKQFSDHFAMPIDKFKDSQRARELQQRINPFLLRRTKLQVAPELPDKTEMIVYCEMGQEQRKVYDTYKTELQRFLLGLNEEDYAQNSMHILSGLTKLRQICNSPALLSDQAFYGDESAKLTELVEQIDQHSTQHKILIFSQFVGMLDLIKRELDKRAIAHAMLTGKTRNRAEEVERFQNDPEVRVFLISLKAGGTGLNLTAADYVYIVDPWWNPAAENQAIDRCYRIGQKKNVVAVRLICPDTIEEKIQRLQESKRELVRDLIKTDAGILKSLTRDELVRLL